MDNRTFDTSLSKYRTPLKITDYVWRTLPSNLFRPLTEEQKADVAATRDLPLFVVALTPHRVPWPPTPRDRTATRQAWNMHHPCGSARRVFPPRLLALRRAPEFDPP